MKWDNEPWTGSREDYVKATVGFLVIAFTFVAWGFVLAGL